MKSKPVQFCRIILYCMEHYSESTEERVGNLLNSHERVIKIYKMLESNPTEQEIGQELSAGVKEKFSLDEDYDFTDEKSGAIHDTLKYSMDEEYDDWLVNDDGKNNINDLIKETVALETTGKTGFYYLDKKRTQSIFKRSGYQLPSTLNNLSSNTIIHTIDDNVNKKTIILLKANNLSDGSVIGKIALQKQVKR